MKELVLTEVAKEIDALLQQVAGGPVSFAVIAGDGTNTQFICNQEMRPFVESLIQFLEGVKEHLDKDQIKEASPCVLH